MPTSAHLFDNDVVLADLLILLLLVMLQDVLGEVT